MTTAAPSNLAADRAMPAVRYPVALVTCALVLTAVAFAGVGWVIFDSSRAAKLVRDQSTRMALTIVALTVLAILFAAWLSVLQELRRWRIDLERAVGERRQAEEALRRAHDELEARIAQRTAELGKANEALQAENFERQRAEEALRASLQITEGIINAIPVRVFWKDKNLVYLGCNAVFARDAGFEDPKDIIGKDDYQMGWRDQAEAYRTGDRHTIENGNSKLNIEESQTTPDGNTITLLTSKIPLRDCHGAISGVLGTYVDITARKIAEEALRESEERFSSAFEQAPNGMALVAPDGRWLKVNRALCELLGYSEAELLTRTFQALTCPEDLEDDLVYVRRMLAGEVRSYQIEKRYVHARGHLVPALLNVSLVRDGHGKPLYFISQIQDITERKQAEETLRKTEARLAHAMSLAQLFAWEYDMASGLFTFSNRYYVLHGTTAEREGGNQMSAPDFVRRFVHPDDAHLIAEEVGKAAATTDPNYRAQLEARIFRRDGELRYVLVSIAVTKDAAGKTIELNGANQDITELKQAEAAVKKVNQELIVASRQAGKAEVATSVLHNVGNVLNSVGVSATLVANQLHHTKAANIAKLAALFDEHRADLATFLTTDSRGQTIPAYLASLAESLATEQTTLLAEIALLRQNIEHIKDIVSMQQANARTSGVTEPISLPDLLEEALRMNADALADHDVATIRDYQARPVVTTDKNRVLQILINLVRNAKLACVDSGRPDQQITVRITSDDRSAQIAVIDNGVGIPAENLARIFNHGFTTRKTGHGFGLHSAKLAAKELGGALTVQSDGPGHGAAFTLELPCHLDIPAHEDSVR